MTKNSKGPELFECQITRDFWDADGVRHCKGTVINVTAQEAMDGVASGALKQVKKPD